ncbi:class I SAM-dependent methyltransferase [Dethiosulfatarculus sandiegensis]|uniref:Type 11 methyltransferase n=1 Tax=Dethiosulfatarculus sandiegensis TaxID=1429043 RepID=A0A0D2JG39_9BACT|nr:class I SAM-dependent methyltransferase [Dethiosulfatarculus sandiegensis]KIX14691.1 type 11 methyltransferase [Dethiosulfatarculus sandiegensis]
MPKTTAFDKHTEAYDKWFEDNEASFRSELDTIRRLIPKGRADGLEVGMGTGQFAGPLGIKTGLEPSEKMALKARAQGITVYSGVAEKMPFPDASFDYLLFVTVICFLDDVFNSFKEAHRVLRPGGCVIVAFIDRQSEMGRQYNAKKGKSRFYKDAAFFSSQEVIDLLERAGFEIKKAKQTLIPGSPNNTIRDGYGQGAFVVIKAMA